MMQIGLFMIYTILMVGPFILTVINFINLVSEKKIAEDKIDVIIFIAGIFLTVILYCFLGFEDYDKQLYRDIGASINKPLHAPIASFEMPTVTIIAWIAITAYVILRVRKWNLSPIAIVICLSGMLIGCCLSMVWIIQLGKNIRNIEVLYLSLFPINYILCSIRLWWQILKNANQSDRRAKVYDHSFLQRCNLILQDSKNWSWIAIILTIPFLMLIFIILTLLGQQPDSIIRAFTQTSDWQLSTKISPPTVEIDSHYLCTVSLRGHKKVVKPLRYGIRKGNKIVVNRQLCVANAFEDLLQEKMPKFHKCVRYIYDTYGYPLSKHIKTAIAADITYLCMKPLEYLFVIILYLFDKQPENRIAIQYLPKKEVLKNES